MLNNRLFYLNNEKLKCKGVNIEYEPWQIEEMVKCSSDINYFCHNYVKIVNVDTGLSNFDMYPYQEKMINIMNDNRFVVILNPRQSGKCVSSKTKVKIRNKNTGAIEKISIGELYNRLNYK